MKKLILTLLLCIFLSFAFTACNAVNPSVPSRGTASSNVTSQNSDVESMPDHSSTSSQNGTTDDSLPNSDTVFHTVFFVTNCDVTLDPITVKHGEKAEEPHAIEKAGYTLDGWYSSGEKWSFIGYTVTEDITLEAKWIGNKNTLRFDRNGATSGAMVAMTVRCGDTISLPTCYYSKEGCIFVGWATTPTGEAIYKVGDTYRMGASSEYILYATWQISPCLDNAHVFYDWIIEKEAVCNEAGIRTHTCKNCFVYTETESYENTENHKYENFVCLNCKSEIEPVFTLSEDGQYYILKNAALGNPIEYTVPKSYNGLPVTEIGNLAFENSATLKKLTVNDNIRVINKYSVGGCDSLESVSINGADYIHMGAFYGCDNLKNITLENVGTLGEYAFANCHSIESLTIGENVHVIEERAFYICKSLKEVTVKEGNVKIKGGAFESCTSLTKVSLPSSLTNIDPLAFADCPMLVEFTVEHQNESYAVMEKAFLVQIDKASKDISLIIVAPGAVKEEISIPSGITAISSYVFRHMTQLKKVIFPDTLKSVGKEAFFDSGLTEINFNKVEVVEDYAFGKTKLTSVIISNSVKEIKRYAFQYCYDLMEICIPSSVEAIGVAVFNNVGTESKRLHVYLELSEGEDFPSGWDKFWLRTATYEIHYGYIFE